MLFMLFVIAGGVIAAAVGVAALYDYRARRRGSKVSVSAEQASSNRRNVEAALDPSRQDRLPGGL
jgi:Flp pilus assembly protein TadB